MGGVSSVKPADKQTGAVATNSKAVDPQDKKFSCTESCNTVAKVAAAFFVFALLTIATVAIVVYIPKAAVIVFPVLSVIAFASLVTMVHQMVKGKETAKKLAPLPAQA